MLKPIFYSLIFSFIYFILSLYVLNYNLVKNTITGNYPLIFKSRLLLALIEGAWTAFSKLDLILTIITSLLIGINVVLIIKTLKKLKSRGKVKLSVGGGAILGIVTTGCSSCGFSFLSLFGISLGALLPSGALSIHILTIILLSFSIIYILRNLNKEDICSLSKENLK